MSYKFTPGPWQAKDWRVCAGIDEHGKIIEGRRLEVICDTGSNKASRTVENAANAILIATAPDLLAACIDIESKIVDYEAGRINWRPDDFLQRVRAAIAKATAPPT